MINAEKIVFEKQNYYTPSWSGVTTVKILEVLPKGKVRVKAGESIFVRSIQLKMQTQAVKHGRVLRENVKRRQKRTKRSNNLKQWFHLDYMDGIKNFYLSVVSYTTLLKLYYYPIAHYGLTNKQESDKYGRWFIKWTDWVMWF